LTHAMCRAREWRAGRRFIDGAHERPAPASARGKRAHRVRVEIT
jgi:hypothetical protein